MPPATGGDAAAASTPATIDEPPALGETPAADETLDGALVADYLDRLGLAAPPPPTREGLALLVARHLETVPFENLDVAEGRPIVLGARRAAEKIARRRRGGFCYELNEGFRGLLAALGFAVHRIEGRVWVEGEVRFGAPFDHLALVVALPEGDHLVDVGFGDNNRRPLRLPEDATRDLSGVYRLAPSRPGFHLLQRAGTDAGAPRALYEMTLAPRPLAAFAAMAAFHQTSPASIFTRGLVCTRATTEGRLTLAKGRLVTTAGGLRTETAVDDADRERVLEALFGIRPGAAGPG